MKAFSFAALSKIGKLIDEHFESIGHKFLGLIPKRRGTRIIFDAEPNSLTSLFMEALGDSEPTKPEEDTLKSLLMIADSYVNALKERTKAQVLHDINAYVSDRRSENKPINTSQVKKIFDEKMDKAKEHFEIIGNAESNKAKNTAKALKFSKIGQAMGVEDPTVAFIPTLDERNDPETLRLHVLPDGITPRCWKLSELGSEYHKKGDKYPKIQGTNPMCRCHLVIVGPNFGFKNGKIAFISQGWDELKYQRETFSPPPSAEEYYPKKKKQKSS